MVKIKAVAKESGKLNVFKIKSIGAYRDLEDSSHGQKCQNFKLSICQNVKMSKFPNVKYQNVKISKCQNVNMSLLTNLTEKFQRNFE